MFRWALSFVLAALALAVPAAASAPSYRDGHYSGRVQIDPASGVGGKVSFVVGRGVITKLKTIDELTCTQPSAASGVEGTENYTLAAKSKKIRIARNGAFAFKGNVGQAHLVFKGKLSGRTANGKVFVSEQPTKTIFCQLSEELRFTARQRPSSQPPRKRSSTPTSS